MKSRMMIAVRISIRYVSPERNPLKGEPNRVMIMFLERASKNDLDWPGPEQAYLDRTHVYLYYPNGAGTSKLSNTFLERKLGVAGTTRNLNTVTKLLALTHPKG